MDKATIFDVQDLDEMFVNIGFITTNQNGNIEHFTWNGNYITRNKEIPASAKNLDFICGKGLDYCFDGDRGGYARFNFCISNESFHFYNPYNCSIQDFSQEWSTMLLNNHTEQYAKYFISLYKQRIGVLKDANRRLGCLIGKNNRICDNNKNFDEKKFIIKQCKEIAYQRRQNNKTISSCKDKIHNLQEILLALSLEG